ncbi:MAG: endonuclease III [Clostridia bacterium]|nr:endonuclease III [Clostridia bacterium]
MTQVNRTKRKRLLALVRERLSAHYPEAKCALNYEGDPWRLLIMTRLSAQCTDARVNEICKELFAKYPDCEALANADVEDVARIIRPIGLFRMKAANIVDASREVLLRFGGRVPSSMDELLSLPGVGRKTANLIIGDIYEGPAVVCDTHFMTVFARLGMYPEKLRDADKIEKIMRDTDEFLDGAELCHRVVTFGREVCTARSPLCGSCPLSDICRHRLGKEAELDE